MSTFVCDVWLTLPTYIPSTLSSSSSSSWKAWGQPSSSHKALALHGFLDNTGSFDLLGPALAKVPYNSTVAVLVARNAMAAYTASHTRMLKAGNHLV